VRRGYVLVAVACCYAAIASAQQPYQSIGPVEARSSVLFKSATLVRALPDGKILLHDIRGRQVVMLSVGLDSAIAVVDATSATDIAYHSRVGGLISWKGDSSLFVDPEASALLVIDGTGIIRRVMALPSSISILCLLGGPTGTPATDANGRIFCRLPPAKRQIRSANPKEITGAEVDDSAALIRYDPATRKMDTLAFVAVAKTKIVPTEGSSCGEMWITPQINPLPMVDDWALMADGSIAIVRGRDYHVDWLSREGIPSSTARLPTSWRRLSDEDKSAYIDSTRAVQERLRNGGAAPAPDARADSGRAPCDRSRQRTVRVFQDVENPLSAAYTSGRAAPPPLIFVPSSDLPDYVPQFGLGSARGDLDGRLWIRTLQVVNGGLIYDVVARDGKLIAHILLPPGREIAGFGPNGAVYMGVVEGTGVRLELARFK
jgi:hypothetical protein